MVNHVAFESEYDALSEAVQDEMRAMAALLQLYGPRLGRPWIDTLTSSRHANMKELRFTADGGVWRGAFAFDLERKAVLLVAGDKAGVAQRRFYWNLIAKADKRLDEHLAALEKEK
ncbi:MAG TPA: type II toxin-antitoxin system RelE/ParE family toxin [Sphingomicrobium sp.]|nr:type II toxin-antitoxin system RelE/ParE family toxin [Sphingomicrobium sp.]